MGRVQSSNIVAIGVHPAVRITKRDSMATRLGPSRAYESRVRRRVRRKEGDYTETGFFGSIPDHRGWRPPMHEAHTGMDSETLGTGVHDPKAFRRFSGDKATVVRMYADRDLSLV